MTKFDNLNNICIVCRDVKKFLYGVPCPHRFRLIQNMTTLTKCWKWIFFFLLGEPKIIIIIIILLWEQWIGK